MRSSFILSYRSTQTNVDSIIISSGRQKILSYLQSFWNMLLIVATSMWSLQIKSYQIHWVHCWLLVCQELCALIVGLGLWTWRVLLLSERNLVSHGTSEHESSPSSSPTKSKYGSSLSDISHPLSQEQTQGFSYVFKSCFKKIWSNCRRHHFRYAEN